jgi:hypothetical protein
MPSTGAVGGDTLTAQLEWVFSPPEIFDYVNLLYDAVFGPVVPLRTAEEREQARAEAVNMLRQRFPGAYRSGGWLAGLDWLRASEQA